MNTAINAFFLSYLSRHGFFKDHEIFGSQHWENQAEPQANQAKEVRKGSAQEFNLMAAEGMQNLEMDYETLAKSIQEFDKMIVEGVNKKELEYELVYALPWFTDSDSILPDTGEDADNLSEERHLRKMLLGLATTIRAVIASEGLSQEMQSRGVSLSTKSLKTRVLKARQTQGALLGIACWLLVGLTLLMFTPRENRPGFPSITLGTIFLTLGGFCGGSLLAKNTPPEELVS